MSDAVARGRFEVSIAPAGAPEDPVGLMGLDKTYRGDLEARSLGRMLAVRTPVDGSAGYVAMERVTGVLGGREGSFVLQHSGVMDRGAGTLSVTVVPDSGAGALAGLIGSMDIEIAPDGGHSYVLRYRLPD